MRITSTSLGLACALVVCVAPASAGEWQYRVRRGENLWSIVAANLTGPQWLAPLQRLNRVSNPAQLTPGSELRIPLAWTRRTLAAGSVDATTGTVTSGSQALHVQSQVRAGEVIRTGANGQVTLRFPDGSTMRIYPQSEVAIEQVEILGRSAQLVARINVRRGYTESVVRPGSVIRRSDVQVASPYAITAVRGTHFRVNAEPEQRRGSTGVLQGHVQVTPLQGGRSVALAAGEGAPATANGNAAVRPLLSAPQPVNLPARIEQLPLRVEVAPVAGASGYSADLSIDAEHEHIVASTRSDSPALLFADAPDGTLYLRLRAIDADGVEGQDAQATLVVDARPEPPFLMQPAADAMLAGGPTEFTWAKRPDATGYDFELYRADAQGQPLGVALEHRHTTEPRLTLSLPAVTDAQPHAWRVRTTTAAEGQGPFGQAAPFKLVAPGPGVEPPGFSGKTMQLSWPKQPYAARWKVELAHDAQFTRIYQQSEVDVPKLSLPRPPAGTYNIRIAWVDAQGRQGPWSATQQIDVPRRKPWWVAGALLLVPLL